MKLKELMEKPLKELLEDYIVLYSPECDYIYGIVLSFKRIDEIIQNNLDIPLKESK